MHKTQTQNNGGVTVKSLLVIQRNTKQYEQYGWYRPKEDIDTTTMQKAVYITKKWRSLVIGGGGSQSFSQYTENT